MGANLSSNQKKKTTQYSPQNTTDNNVIPFANTQYKGNQAAVNSLNNLYSSRLNSSTTKEKLEKEFNQLVETIRNETIKKHVMQQLETIKKRKNTIKKHLTELQKDNSVIGKDKTLKLKEEFKKLEELEKQKLEELEKHYSRLREEKGKEVSGGSNKSSKKQIKSIKTNQNKSIKTNQNKSNLHQRKTN